MRKIGGLIAVVLVALLMITGCDNSASSNNKDEEWLEFLSMIMANQPNADVSWYDPEAPEYTLDTANDIIGLASIVNSGYDFADKTINLAAGTYDFSQIDATGASSFIGLGEREGDANAFAGTFNGNGATIKGVDLNYPAGYQEGTVDEAHESNMAVGFFGVVKGTDSNPAEIKELVFENCSLYSTSNSTGIAVGYAEYATISGITVKNCEITGPQGVAGVVGRLYEGGEIFDCKVSDSTIHADAATVDYDGTGTGNYNAAGIVGSASYHTNSTGSILIYDNIVDLTGDGEIVATDNYAGGISGNATGIVRIYGNTVKVNSTDQISVTRNPSSYSASTINGTGAATYASADSSVTGNTVVIGGVSNTENGNGRITKN